MLESYLLYEAPANAVKPAWIARKKEVSPPLALAQLNAGLCAVGAVAFKEMEPQNVTACFARKSDAGKFDKFYQYQVERSVTAWAFKNANPENAEAIYNFALLCGDADEADFLNAITWVLPDRHLPEVLKMMEDPKNTLRLRYSCVKIGFHVLNNGAGAPGFDRFSKKPQIFTKQVQQLAAKHNAMK